VAMLALQPRRYDALTRLAVRFIHPRLIITQSAGMASQLAAVGCSIATMRSGVDADRFTPATAGERRRLRLELGLSPDAYIVLHVGHINTNRNVQALALLQNAGCQAVLVGSTSTPQDDSLSHRLQEQGVIVVRSHVTNIASYYRAADCYVFPVMSNEAAIALPLSVLEAMACDLPVVTTPFGDLPALFPAADGVRFAADEDALVRCVLAVRDSGAPQTRFLIREYTWDAVADAVMAEVTAQR
jgi:glycosyltransferase involved in cell wall biosynthesis